MNNTQILDQELSLRNQHSGRLVQPRYVSLPLPGGRSSVPAAALSDDGTGSSDSGSGHAGQGVGSPSSTSQLPLHAVVMPPGRGQGILEREPAAQSMQQSRTLAEPSQQSVASGSGRPGANADTRVGGRYSGNETHRARANSQSTRSADRNPVQPSQDADAGEADRPYDGQGRPEPAARGTHVDMPNRQARRRQETIEKRTAVRIASLNMNGFGRLQAGHPENKWGNIYRVMKEQRVAVLLLQETHMTAERASAIEKMTAYNLKVFFSPHPERPTAREGVAVVLNKKLLKIGGAAARVIVPGRALHMTVPWHGTDILEILCVYAPTSDGEAVRKDFFEKVSGYYSSHPRTPRPTVMAGDFNTVEDIVDRMPITGGLDSSVESLDDLKMNLGLMMTDGWRMVNPTAREFTFQRGEYFARLDRIYVEENTFRKTRGWRIHEGLIRSDHNMISMELACESAPMVGKGRPTFSTYLLQDKKTTTFLRERGLRATQEIAALEREGVRSEQKNPQTVLAAMKKDWLDFARKREKEIVPRLLTEIRALEAELKSVKSNSAMPDEDKAPTMAALAAQIKTLQERRLNQMKANGKAKHRIEGERPTKYWTQLHREKKLRDIMMAFEKEGVRAAEPNIGPGPVYETDSKRMAEMARDYHENLQRDSLGDNRSRTNREDAIATALDAI